MIDVWLGRTNRFLLLLSFYLSMHRVPKEVRNGGTISIAKLFFFHVATLIFTERKKTLKSQKMGKSIACSFSHICLPFLAKTHFTCSISFGVRVCVCVFKKKLLMTISTKLKEEEEEPKG